MANYKEEMKLTEQEIEAIKPTQDECAKITADMELYKPQEFKGCFANDEHDKLIKRKIADAAQEKCLRVLSSVELPELREQIAEYIGRCSFHSGLSYEEEISQLTCRETSAAIVAIIQPIIASLKAENEELKKQVAEYGDLIDLQIDEIAEMDGYETAQADEMNGLKARLSTARAEVEELKKNVDIYEELLANVLDVMNEADVELPYLAPDKGGK